MLLGLRPVASVPISAPMWRSESGGLTAILNSLSASQRVPSGSDVPSPLAVEDSALPSVLADISHFSSLESRVVAHSLTLA